MLSTSFIKGHKRRYHMNNGKSILLGLIIAGCMAFAGCTHNQGSNTVVGAGAGALGGGLLGGAVGGTTGAVIGGTAGALTGGYVGNRYGT
jgi:hypothetical protein